MKCIQRIRLIELKRSCKSFSTGKHTLESAQYTSPPATLVWQLAKQHGLCKGCVIGQVSSLTIIQAILHLSYCTPATSPIFTNYMSLARTSFWPTALFLSLWHWSPIICSQLTAGSWQSQGGTQETLNHHPTVLSTLLYPLPRVGDERFAELLSGISILPLMSGTLTSSPVHKEVAK